MADGRSETFFGAGRWPQHGENSFTQQQTPPGQHGQASQVQTPVSQQPQSQTQLQEVPQQLAEHAGLAWGAEAEANNEANKSANRYIKNLRVEKWLTQIEKMNTI